MGERRGRATPPSAHRLAPSSPRRAAATLRSVKNARDRTGAAALVGAAVTGLIAFALFLAGGLLLWANSHYKDADGYLSTGSQRFDSREYAITTPNLEVGAGGPGVMVKAGRYGESRRRG